MNFLGGSLKVKQLGIWLTAIAFAGASLLVPTPASSTSAAFHVPLIIEVVMAVVSIGGALLFLVGLHSFKVKLRVAYALIAVGMMVYAIALVQLPIFQVLNLFSSWYVAQGWLNLPYDLSAFLLLLGVLRYASLLQARSRLLDPLVIFAVVALAVIVSPLLPHSGNFYGSMGSLIINVALTSISAVLLTFATIGFLIIKRAAGPAYTKALAWSFLGVGLLAFATITTVYFQLNGFTRFYVTSGLFFIPFLTGVACNLRAAVAFNNIARF